MDVVRKIKGRFKNLVNFIFIKNDKLNIGSILEMQAIMHYSDFCHSNFSKKNIKIKIGLYKMAILPVAL